MPFTRYQLRNEYGLADPDICRGADKDDSEGLLEAVAMAGLVGVLRQLGDLAEFAAEMFHDLHEEVMATAARGHTLVVRAHQLEAEVPAIEKSFLSRNNHPSFFTNAGIDWRHILHTDQNLITRGDLPRCVMNSYEECWGPPRLFLLDKFDVAGTGTCLKRYTDPSFFKNATDSYKLKALDIQRENKMHRTMKKGTPLRNGETHHNSATHAKLHELFMEERNGNNFDNPASLVKLKKRQLNGSPFDFRSGKSYMEKFLQTPSPEHKVIYETSVDPPLLKLTLDSSSESGADTVDIGIVSPVKRSSEIKENTCSSPDSLQMPLNPNKEELNSEISTVGNAKAPVLASAFDTTRVPSITSRVTAENGPLADGEQNHKSGLYVGTPDEVTGEIENYTDVSATMETDTESEDEHSVNSDLSVFSSGKCGSASDAYEGQLNIHGFSSDSQLFRISTVSDETTEAFSGARNIASEDETSSFQMPAVMDIQGSSPSGFVYANAIIDLREASGSSGLSNRNIKPLLDELHGGDEAISSGAMLRPSRSPELNTEYESRCNYLDQVCQTGSTKENCEENLAPLAEISMKSTIIPLDKKLSSVLPETGHLDKKILPHVLEVMRSANSALEVYSLSEVAVDWKRTTPLVEILQCQGTDEQQPHSVHSETSAHLDNYLLPHMSEVSDDVAAPTACGTIIHDDYGNHGSVPSDLIVYPSRSPMISEEHHPGSEIPYEQSQKFTKRIYPENLIYSEVETDQGKVSTEDSDSVVSKAGSCKNSQQKDITQNSTLTEKMDTAILGNKENVTVPPIQVHGESPGRDGTCANSSNLFTGRIQPHVGQEVCFALDEPRLGDLPCQHPIQSVGVFAQSVDQEVDQVKHTIASLASGYGSVHEATNLGMVEMPPLPPLPPVQWRLGKAQLDYRDSQIDGHSEESFPLTSEYGVDRKGQFDFSAAVLQGVESRNMYTLSEDVEEKQHHYSDKSADSLVQPPGSVVNISGMADDTSIQHSSTSFENMQSAPSFVVEAMSNKRQECVSLVEESDTEGFRRPFAQARGLEKTISRRDAVCPLGNRAVLSDPYIVDRATEGAIVQTKFPECSTQVDDFVGMPINQTANGKEQPLNNQENQAPFNLEGQPQVNDEFHHPTDAFVHPLHDLAKVGGEMQPTCIPAIKPCLPTSEAAPLSHSKASSFSANKKANGNPVIKNPRPGDPLVDVFAALDRSRLRKVSKQVRPQVGSRVEERDSLLEQIRTKSFNLRPAAGTRPSIQRIQGPKTNLRVAAILEKANAIRQATAGSDEEGDDDSWSDT